jgi:hypothetical protein
MSPLEVTLLLNLYSLRNYERPPFPAYIEAISRFKKENLIDDTFKVTEKGKVYIEALLNIPLPVALWKIPKDA